MYKITTPENISVLTENPKWIRVHDRNPNCFILCAKERAEGVAYKGNPLLFSEGATIQEIDGGDEFYALQLENETLKAQLAEAEEVAIDLYEASLIQEDINAEQDEAIIEIYEAMEVITNG